MPLLVHMQEAWSREEVEAAVADYLRRLDRELRGEPYSKAEHNRQLQALLKNRTRGSIEPKHQNNNCEGQAHSGGFPDVRHRFSRRTRPDEPGGTAIPVVAAAVNLRRHRAGGANVWANRASRPECDCILLESPLPETRFMSIATEEIIRVCEALPPEKQAEVVDFAKFLLARQDEEAWERILAEERPRPRLERFLRESAAEGDEPLDINRL
jgi:hypothetical protein